jgi:hypothetical protein
LKVFNGYVKTLKFFVKEEMEKIIKDVIDYKKLLELTPDKMKKNENEWKIYNDKKNRLDRKIDGHISGEFDIILKVPQKKMILNSILKYINA